VSARVAVVGLGKIGLPLAVQIAGKGFRVCGADISSSVANLVSKGRAPYPGEPGLAERLRIAVDDGLLNATTDTTAAVAASDVVIVVVPLVTEPSGGLDFSSVDAATVAVAAGLRAGTLVSYETTLPVHTTRQRLAPALAEGSGLCPGADFALCHSPERVSSGQIFADLRRYPKLVGGLDAASGRSAADFYKSVLDFDERPDLAHPNGVWDLGSPEATELTKLAETTYRDVNIALANEFARFAASAGLDAYQVIEAANSQPFSHIHLPGISVGGHCIPVYPHLYLAGDPSARLPAAAREINNAVPAEAVRLLANLTRGLAGLRVVILGAAYRPGVKATAFSGVFPIAAELSRHGAAPVVHDPLYTSAELAGLGLEPYRIGESCDAAILHTGHSDYAALTPADLPGVRAVIDGRAIMDARAWESVPRMVLGVGTMGVLGTAAAERPGRNASNYHSVGLTAGDDGTGAYHGA
jgi:UDP-N-acetyl-D-glucosamine dehydrogenase